MLYRRGAADAGGGGMSAFENQNTPVCGRLVTALDVRRLIGPMVRLQGIAVGSRSGFEAMNRAIGQHGLRPVIDRSFPLEATAEAFALMERGGHFGKIAVTLA